MPKKIESQPNTAGNPREGHMMAMAKTAEATTDSEPALGGLPPTMIELVLEYDRLFQLPYRSLSPDQQMTMSVYETIFCLNGHEITEFLPSIVGAMLPFYREAKHTPADELKPGGRETIANVEQLCSRLGVCGSGLVLVAS